MLHLLSLVDVRTRASDLSLVWSCRWDKVLSLPSWEKMEPLVKGGGSQISRTLMLQLIIFETTASAAQLGEGTAVAAHQVRR